MITPVGDVHGAVLPGVAGVPAIADGCRIQKLPDQAALRPDPFRYRTANLHDLPVAIVGDDLEAAPFLVLDWWAVVHVRRVVETSCIVAGIVQFRGMAIVIYHDVDMDHAVVHRVCN